MYPVTGAEKTFDDIRVLFTVKMISSLGFIHLMKSIYEKALCKHYL